MSWINFLEDVVKKQPTKDALIEQKSGRRLTYQQLDEQVKKLVSFLKVHKVEKGDRVVYLNTNSLEHVTLFLACAKLGAIFVPMNWRLGNHEKEEIIEQVAPKLILCQDNCQLNLEGHPFIRIGEIDVASYVPCHDVIETDLSEPLLMLFTSGSTGSPKGVLLHGEMLKSNQEQTVANWGLLATDRTIVETPFFHTGGYNVLMLPLLSIGGTCVLAEKFDLDNLFKTIRDEKISVYFGVPTMFQSIVHSEEFKQADLSSLRFIISGGAYCPVELIKTFKDKNLVLKQGFGLTEVGPNCFLLEEEDAIRKVGSIGKPMPHSEVLLINEQGLVPDGAIGELVIKGPHVCAGYFQNENLFQESLYNGYFKTGDLAVRDEDGYYFIVGRKKDMYISGGENVYPAEVEKKLNSHPNIEEAIVVAVSDQKWGEVGLAFYTGKELSLKDLREYLNPRLSRYKHPQYLNRVKNFPLLDNGKIDRKTLKLMAGQLIGG